MSGAFTHWNQSSIKCEIMSNQQLAAELHKGVIKNFEKQKVYSYFKHNIYLWYWSCGYAIKK